MGQIVLMGSVSLDGMFEGPDGGLEWQTVDLELHQHFNDVLRGAGGFLDGRVTYQLMSGYWPTAGEDPDASPVEVEFAEIWKDMPKVVYSTTLEGVDWNATLSRDVVPQEVEELRTRASGDLFVGGAILADSFRKLDLIDEYRIYVHPVILGGGRALFGRSDTITRIRLVETRLFESGVAMLRYQRA